MTGHVMTEPALIRQFTLAGVAVLTLRSLRTDKHFTYRIRQAVDQDTGEEKAFWFVSVLADRDRYLYVGTIAGASEKFSLTRNSKFTEEAACVKAWRYFWAGIAAGVVAAELEIRHEGRCGRCGRPLTTPESVDTGFGPECAAHLGIEWAVRTVPVPVVSGPVTAPGELARCAEGINEIHG